MCSVGQTRPLPHNKNHHLLLHALHHNKKPHCVLTNFYGAGEPKLDMCADAMSLSTYQMLALRGAFLEAWTKYHKHFWLVWGSLSPMGAPNDMSCNTLKHPDDYPDPELNSEHSTEQNPTSV